MEIHRDKESGLKHLNIKARGKSIETPACLVYSRGGMVPHLTNHNLSLVNNNSDKLCHLPLASVYEQPGPDVMKKFAGTFHEFSSSQDKIWILNTNDSYVLKADTHKYNEEKCISIWAPSGRRKITPEEYMKIVDIFSFDVAIAPSDTIPSGVSTKRCRKSTERSARFLDQCLKIKEEKELTVPILGVVEGGDSVVFREKSAISVAASNVNGYVLGGFNLITSNWKELLQLTMKHLEEEKAKFMFGVLTPLEVVEAVELGVDIFDTVISYDVTERGCALNFAFTNRETNIQNGSCVEGSRTKKVKKDENKEAVRKDLRTFEMDLNDKRYFDDSQPLVPGCQCYCCSHHARAYVHHLLVTKEMLASVLLMMHNLTYWSEFFKEIRKCMTEERFHEMKEILREGNT